LAILWANLTAASLSGTIQKSSQNSLFIHFLTSSSILNLSSLSGSSSVKMIISEYLSTISHIFGLLSLSLIHGAQKTVIILPVLTLSKNFKTDVKAFGVCA